MFSDFKIRSLTAAGLTLLSFLILFLGSIYLKIFIFLLSVILIFEWMRIISQTQWIIRGLIAVIISFFVYFTDGYTALDLLFIISGSIIISSFSTYFNIPSFWSCFGFIYILSSLSFLEYLRNFENGFLVFTAAYHLKRGICCGSGCRHCPFEPKNIAGSKTTAVKRKTA